MYSTYEWDTSPYIHAIYTTVRTSILEMCMDMCLDTQQWMVRQNSWWSLKLGSAGERRDESCLGQWNRCLFSCPHGWGWLCVPPRAGELARMLDGDAWCLSKEWFGLEGTFKGPLIHLPCHAPSHFQLGQVAQRHIQAEFECFQGWGIHQLSGQCVLVFYHLHC